MAYLFLVKPERHVVPEIKSLRSAAFERPALPGDPSDCMVALEATIGPADASEAEIFAFTVATPATLAHD